jgi:hypothetical protein
MGLQHFLTNYQRDYLKQLILECEVQRFTRQESLAYIHAKLKIPISDSYMDRTKRIVKKSLIQKLQYLREHIEQFFRRIAEIEKLQKEAWAVYHANQNKPYVQMDCILELHQLTITLGNLYEILPAFTGQSLVTYEDNIPAYTRMVTEDTRSMCDESNKRG